MSDGIIAISDTFLPTLQQVPREVAGQVTSTLEMLRTTPEIGRASCRERV